MIVTITLETLLGLTQTPARLHGYGPLPAAMARDLAATGTWRCAAVDDHATLLGLGTRTWTPAYVPGTPLTRFTTARDLTCRFPGCPTPATRCDNDHRHPHPKGATCTCNLQHLCRRHHILKTTGAFTSRPTSPGTRTAGTAGTGGTNDTITWDDTITWTTPTGHTYPAPPTPFAPRPGAPQPAASPPRAPDPAPRPDDEEPPPFCPQLPTIIPRGERDQR